MKLSATRVLAGVTLAAVVFFLPSARVDAAMISKTLEDNTRITPPGMIVATGAGIPKFKKGTVVTLNEVGEVLEGILAENANLPYETGTPRDSVRLSGMNFVAPPPMIMYASVEAKPNWILPFKGGTKVVFNDRGEVVFGTVANGNESVLLNPANRLAVDDGEISFHKNGMVAACTLGSNSYLRPVGWQQILTENFADGTACAGFVEFKGGKPVKLTEKGEVVKGTLNKDTKLRAPNAYSPGAVEIRVFAAGTTVEFADNGLATKAAK